MRPLAGTCALVITFSCGGKPVGSKVPRANPAHVGGAAAAAAALITLADPAAARQRQEDRGGARKDDRSKRVKETVPEDVLFREEQSGADPAADAQKLPPCEEEGKTSADKQEKAKGTSLELIPRQRPTKTTPCLEPKKKAESEDQDARPE